MNTIQSIIFKTIPKSPLYTVTRAWEKRKFIRRYGYENPLLDEGPLPRLKDAEKFKHIPDHKPKDRWNTKRALFGQNDYIDILGEGNIHPVKLLTHVPNWLRGFQGNEFQMLRRRAQTHSYYRFARPKKWNDLMKRLRYLYKWLNKKTPG